jgi:hypothetical protein
MVKNSGSAPGGWQTTASPIGGLDMRVSLASIFDGRFVLSRHDVRGYQKTQIENRLTVRRTPMTQDMLPSLRIERTRPLHPRMVSHRFVTPLSDRRPQID